MEDSTWSEEQKEKVLQHMRVAMTPSCNDVASLLGTTSSEIKREVTALAKESEQWRDVMITLVGEDAKWTTTEEEQLIRSQVHLICYDSLAKDLEVKFTKKQIRDKISKMLTTPEGRRKMARIEEESRTKSEQQELLEAREAKRKAVIAVFDDQKEVVHALFKNSLDTIFTAYQKNSDDVLHHLDANLKGLESHIHMNMAEKLGYTDRLFRQKLDLARELYSEPEIVPKKASPKRSAPKPKQNRRIIRKWEWKVSSITSPLPSSPIDPTFPLPSSPRGSTLPLPLPSPEEWVTRIGLAEHWGKFEEQGYTTYKKITSLDNKEKIDEMGITKLADRVVLLHEVAALKQIL